MDIVRERGQEEIQGRHSRGRRQRNLGSRKKRGDCLQEKVVKEKKNLQRPLGLIHLTYMYEAPMYAGPWDID